MKASIYQGNKSFSIIEKELEAPGDREVRIKVAYAGVCGTDMHIFHGMMDKRVPMPMTIGHEMSGEIEAIGAEVNDLSVGDRVVVRPLDDRLAKPSDNGYHHICADLKFIGIDSPGCMQQYWTVPDFTVHKLPQDIDLQLAALIEPLSVATHDIRLSGIKAGETAVVLGGGPIGLLVALVAKEAGANVIVSEINSKRIHKAKELGLMAVNPLEADLVGYVAERTENKLADVVFEVSGVQAAVDIMTEVAGIRGRIVMVAIHGQPRPVNLFKFFWKELQLIGARVYEREDYEKAIKLVSSGKLPLKKLITDIKPLTKIQEVFEGIDHAPDGMKVLMDCQQ